MSFFVESDSAPARRPCVASSKHRKGTNGVCTNGVTATFMFLTDFLGTPVNLLLYSQKCQGVFVTPICQIHYFCIGHISVDPICPQPRKTAQDQPGRKANSGISGAQPANSVCSEAVRWRVLSGFCVWSRFCWQSCVLMTTALVAILPF